MSQVSLFIATSRAFWAEAARAIGESVKGPARVVVPTALHVNLLREALAAQDSRVPLRIATLSAWLEDESDRHADSQHTVPASHSERLMGLYAELRQHAWLKKLFSARRNTDLLPLAQTLLALSDELTLNLLPQLQLSPAAVAQRWQAALSQLTPSARHVLSDEAQLVWTIWNSQLDGNDPGALRYARMMCLADHAQSPLVWIRGADAGAFETAFLDAWGKRQEVLTIAPDWRASALRPLYSAVWPELADEPGEIAIPVALPQQGVALCDAHGMEDEARQGAQTIIEWLMAGKTRIAIVAQDRAVARRIRALLERAGVYVADETGWELSTTRAAAVVAAWFDVIASRAETIALLDLLKSPFLFADLPEKSTQVMRIEIALRRANVQGGWEAALAVLDQLPQERQLLNDIAGQAARFSQRKPLREWIATTVDAFHTLGVAGALLDDAAGMQVMALLAALEQDCHRLEQAFSLAEWRALVTLQLETTDFIPPQTDKRVAMLPLNGARLRCFDAVLLVGADAEHLPSQSNETLFFANAVRRELGLATRESLQRQQLRDFAELLCANHAVVLSWQSTRDGEPNPVSPWIARLQLGLERHRLAPLPAHRLALRRRELCPTLPSMPVPSAPQLVPKRLSASAYNKLVACPYQFFAGYMLGLSTLDELSDLPQKRDYGEWLHQILKQYHDTLGRHPTALSERPALLSAISERIFKPVLLRSSAALGYYVRWKKALPAYVAWADERESQGWKFAFGEKEFRKKLQWDTGEVLLHGWIDRIDENHAGDVAVLDYKAKKFLALQKQLAQHDDHQLAFYGLLVDRPVSAAHYVALEPHNDKTRDAAAPRYAEWQRLLGEQIADNLDAISAGASLPASGIESVCQYCDVRGLCRKGAWR